jgi:N-acyl-phosphatidylethanolamine-hydrolysing phospholipase D
VFVAGLGSQDVLPAGCKHYCLDWTENVEVKLEAGSARITFVPVCHWGRRGLTDFNTRLWGGFVVELSEKHRLFYSGDTGYCDVFKEIGDCFGGFDLAVLPIGAYEPR